MTFTLSWDSADLLSLSQLPIRGVSATKLYNRVIFPKVSGQVHCSLSDIKKNWISCHPCCLTKTNSLVCFTRSQDDESWRDARSVFRSCRLICNNLITSAHFLDHWSWNPKERMSCLFLFLSYWGLCWFRPPLERHEEILFQQIRHYIRTP